ncbi:LPS translocon maturation chaperone LptM [Chelatococcus reniformis]|uniref:Lipoprotein n=1 Tax=Chelatococcus reniformis TaxID=1494448 RepID=A0A916TWQ4_9HYPH|nr:lipoprotein [Chelatococcus reniformis]GGC46256.1 hypothetical protein GCM10010994_01750 [Chelatococcus reniformis]
MSAPLPALLRVVVVTAVMALALAACGRRGALQPPPDPGAPKQTEAQKADAQSDDDEPDTIVPTPAITGAKKKPKGYTIPKDRFILDSLL